MFEHKMLIIRFITGANQWDESEIVHMEAVQPAPSREQSQ